MKNKYISILLPIYNGQSTLDRCLTSLLKQSFKNIRIICVNDGSSDHTLYMLQKWRNKYPKKMIIINNKYNLGITKSLNIALNKVTTGYFSRIDVDDWWDTNKLSEQYSYIQQNPDIGLLGCNYINIKDGKNIPISLPENDSEIRKRIFKKNPFAHSCIFAKTSLVKYVGGYDDSVKFGQDYDLWLRLYPHTKYHNLQKYLCFRELKNGVSKINQKNQMIQCIKTQIKYINKYNISKFEILYILEPLLIIIKSLIW